MCDEYDDERMQVFWRQLAMRGELAKLEAHDEELGEPAVQPLGTIPEPKRAKPRGLLR